MNKIIIAIIVVAVIAVGGYFLLKGNPQYSAPSPNITTQPLPEETSQTLPSPTTESPVTQEKPSVSQNVVTYTDSGYSPSTLRVKVGATVTFKNNSSQSMWTASAVHPTHRVYSGTGLDEHCPDASGTAFDQCGAGNEYLFTFTKSGTWKYHNHLNPSHTGTIVVEE